MSSNEPGPAKFILLREVDGNRCLCIPVDYSVGLKPLLDALINKWYSGANSIDAEELSSLFRENHV